MAKMALCISYFDAPPEVLNCQQGRNTRVPLWPTFYNTPTALVDRDVCEMDEGTLQLIPYITLVDSNARVFCYSRGKGGAEARLHAKLSIGLGGHVDTVPECMGLHLHLRHEAARELMEETGIEVPPQLFHFTSLLVDRVETVGRVHLGLHTFMPIDDAEISPEKDIIEGGQWLTAKQLNDPTIFDRLEYWSQTVARLML